MAMSVYPLRRSEWMELSFLTFRTKKKGEVADIWRFMVGSHPIIAPTSDSAFK